MSLHNTLPKQTACVYTTNYHNRLHVSSKYKNILLEEEFINLDVQERYINYCNPILQHSRLWHSIMAQYYSLAGG